MTNSIVYHNFVADSQRSPFPVILNDNSEDVEALNYLKTLSEGRWLIGLTLFLALFFAGLYIILAPPTYESNFVIHVEEESDKKPNTMFSEMGAMFNVKTSPSSEVELVKSRLVISRALDKLDLYVAVEPDYFPVIGKWLATKKWNLPIPANLGGYAWKNEQMKVSSFTTPPELLNRNFTVIAREDGKFDLENSDANIAVSGRVGVPLTVNTGPGVVHLLIAKLEATPNVRFRLQRFSKLALLEKIQNNLVVVEQGRLSAVINVVLRGNDPKWVHAVLNEIAKEYISQNSMRKTQEANNALEFLNIQLPELKRQLEESETKYNQFRNGKGTIDVGEEAKSALQQLALAKSRKAELDQKRIELLIRYTPNHPIIEGLDSQRQEVNNEIKKLSSQIRAFPLMEQELLKLSRDVKINTDLYTSLLNTARQLRLITVSSMSNVRLVDSPVLPEKFISFPPMKIWAIAIFAGLVAGITAVFVRKSLCNKIENTNQVEQAGNLPVYSVIPHSHMQQKLQKSRGAARKKTQLLAMAAPLDQAIESLRNFRAVINYSIPSLRNNISLFVSPTPGNGKSFISANLAAVMGSGNKRILLIDADFRNGDLHQYFNVRKSLGFSEALAQQIDINKVIHSAVAPNVDFLSCGELLSSTPELLAQPRLGEMLQLLSARYDMVIINGAPLLQVADSLAIGGYAGAVYIVVQAGVTTSREISRTVNMLRYAGLSAKGFLLNGVDSPKNKSTYQNYNNYTRHWQTQYAATQIERSQNALGGDGVRQA